MYDGNVNVNSIVENVIQMKIGIMINVSASGKLQKGYIWNPAKWSCKNVKYLASNIDDSVTACNKVIEEIKSAQTSFTEKR